MQRSVGGYVIEGELGRGGMAVVYRARQTGLDRPVALKQLLGFHDGDTVHAQRFVQESRLGGSLNHANIVTVFDFFEHEGTPYIAMELVERGALEPYLGRISGAQAFGVIEQVLAGLSVAHARGIVHRDLKPGNVMVTWDGRVKISDFGIAKALDQTVALATRTGSVIGTPAYMAPEQAKAGQVGPWSDLYSLGVMAYQMFVGRLPFDGDAMPLQLLMKHAFEPVPPPLELQPDLDPGVAAWLERMLAKEPADRYESALAAWQALEERVLALLGPHWRRESALPELEAAPPRRPGPPPTPQYETPATPMAAPKPPRRRAPRPRIAVAATLGVGAVLGVVIAVLALGGGSGTEPPATGTQAAATATPAGEDPALVAFRQEVGDICGELNADRQGLAARQRKTRRRVLRAKTVIAQRDALLDEYKHQLAVANQLLPRLEALSTSDRRPQFARRAALSAWRRNVDRLEARRDALNGVRTFADLQQAARIPDRAAVERDAKSLNRRLIQLAPRDCHFDVADSGPAISLRPPPGTTQPESPDVQPSSGTSTAPAPAPTTSAPGGAPSGGDVSPPGTAAKPQGDVSPPAAGGNGGGGGE